MTGLSQPLRRQLFAKSSPTILKPARLYAPIDTRKIVIVALTPVLPQPYPPYSQSLHQVGSVDETRSSADGGCEEVSRQWNSQSVGFVTDVNQGAMGRFFANRDPLLNGYYIVGAGKFKKHVIFVVRTRRWLLYAPSLPSTVSGQPCVCCARTRIMAAA